MIKSSEDGLTVGDEHTEGSEQFELWLHEPETNRSDRIFYSSIEAAARLLYHRYVRELAEQNSPLVAVMIKRMTVHMTETVLSTSTKEPTEEGGGK